MEARRLADINFEVQKANGVYFCIGSPTTVECDKCLRLEPFDKILVLTLKYCSTQSHCTKTLLNGR